MLKEFYYKYIELNFKDYPNLGFDFEINKVLFFVFVALILASVFASYIQSTLALMVRKLLRTSSLGEANARSLPDLGLDKNRVLKFALTRATGSATLIIKEAGKTAPTYEEYINAVMNERQKKLEKKQAKKAKPQAPVSTISSLKELDQIQSELSVNEAKANDALTSTAESQSAELEAHGNKSVGSTHNEAINQSPKTAPKEAVSQSGRTAACESDTEDAITVSSKELLKRSKPDFATAKFYIPEDMEERAVRYYSSRQGSVIKTVFACLALLSLYVGLMLLMPTVLSALNNLLEV